jgi:hypothetical protein
MVGNYPLEIMACEPFLQRIGLKLVRPRQNMAIDALHLHSRNTPAPYPVQGTDFLPKQKEGVHTLYPWPEEEILQNSNSLLPDKSKH